MDETREVKAAVVLGQHIIIQTYICIKINLYLILYKHICTVMYIFVYIYLCVWVCNIVFSMYCYQTFLRL